MAQIKKYPLIYHGNKLIVQQAPYPTDVFWENLKLTEKQRKKKNIMGIFITIIVLSVCFMAIYGLILKQKAISEKETEDQIIVQFIGILISIIITILNGVLQNILVYVSKLEGHPTMTSFNTSLAKKITVASFCNTSLVTFLVVIVILDDKKSKFMKIFGEGGLAENQNYVFISNIIAPLITQLIDIEGIKKKFLRKIELKSKIYLFQLNLN
ncbi:hypothetical protein IMG5_156040 [Ichthyophthirius multifiliis]|uniref:Anoctamin transmembrane domain-containing protein n=1 Tax=Ichthyophthirius multifiliis TaxID=5932 RepID=G0QZE2_ICHMU|nr:hypothetical protein IMG5_156040 [Ichthyophthirius multifiliis]EGR29411.1 hypothetical protein IMG5_156040 [Ichthyophthirius multifiliis]|eukprot:XP_004030647.1 hypothetical protein IMG5_156040 [Ichthyophthirius multifiliis]